MSEVVLVRGGEGEIVRSRIRAEFPDVVVFDDDDGATTIDPSVTIVAGRVPDAAVDAAASLSWVHSWAAGVESDVGPRLRATDITVTSSAGNGAVPLAEHALLLALLLDRGATRWFDSARSARWDRFTHGELFGKTLGVYGFGNIGEALAPRARAFGMTVVGLRRTVGRSTPDIDRMYAPDEMLEFAARCDVLVVAAPLTTHTRGAIDQSVLSALRPGATVVVVSRGGIVVDDDLLDALRSGGVAAAGLDAHATEPLPADSPFWSLENVVVTPHNGATTAATAARGTEIFLDNLRRRVEGEPLVNRVDLVALA
ncbi:NAD(P)-dependent oxidoreductase [Labedella endophytica]|uniref:D-2-hydroxyacid dehydrogenase n=1 Tax=Labedella endophytica TaxID=1523160 RepID=A0A3S0VTI3_9MICO|nr:NAD(P)-dependent oxidoreductase [Labedella endophytica]RUR00927.1 D-2-hydroxyacid dehydrogenase [Labedella endophytica]